jgi:membrane protease YdiL (CAAX protease family)
MLAAALSILLLMLAVAVEALRLPALLTLAVAFVTTMWRPGSRDAAARSSTAIQAACLLVALGAAWSGILLPAGARDGSSCADAFAPFALYRAAGAALVLLAVAVVVRLLGSGTPAIGLRRPTRGELAFAIGALAVVGGVATVVGPALAEPFFGPLPVSLGSVSALAPALLFAIANASMEETMYRGVLMRWVMPAAGVTGALALQAAAFGLAHGVGSDFAASPLPVMAATAAGGLALGMLALRSRSLLLPIAVHAALDIPIYYANACLRL